MIRRTNLELHSCSLIDDNRKILLSLLSEWFYEPLNIERLLEWKLVLQQPWASDLVLEYPLIKPLLERLEKEEVSELQEQLQDEYQAIFNVFNDQGKILAHPWESYYVEQNPTELNSSTYQMRHKLHEFDLRYQMDSFLPEDHISVQLDFLIYLLDYTHAAELNKNFTDFEKGIYTEYWLLKDHLLKWIPAFCDDIQKANSKSIFASLAKLLIQVLEEDYEYVRSLKDGMENE